MSTKQVRYLKRGDWILGPEPRPGQPRLLANVLGVLLKDNGMADVEVMVRQHTFTGQQNADNVVRVWANSDLPHRMKRGDEWPAIPAEPSQGAIMAMASN